MARDDSGSIPEELLRTAAAAAAPRLTPAALRERFGPPGDWEVLAGQLWRAAWDDVAVLVLVVSVSGSMVTVAPATVEPAGEADGSLIVDPRRTALGEPVTVWGALMRQIRLEVLDHPIDVIGADVAAWCLTRVGVPDGSHLGGAPASLFETDIDTGAIVADDIDALAGAESWAADLSPASAADSGAVPAPSREQLVQLQGQLGLPLPEVLALVDGKRPAASEKETAALQEVLGHVPQVKAPPQELVIELSHPRWRPAARVFARRGRRSEREARLVMAYEISGASMAARQTGEREPAWRDRVQRWVTAHGLEDAGDERAPWRGHRRGGTDAAGS
jgi:hypothetical protein